MFTALCLLVTVTVVTAGTTQQSSRAEGDANRDILANVLSVFRNATKARDFLKALANTSQPRWLSSLKRTGRKRIRALRHRISKLHFPAPAVARDLWESFDKDVFTLEVQGAWQQIRKTYSYMLEPAARTLFLQARQVNMASISRFASRLKQIGISGMVWRARTAFAVTYFATFALGFVRGEMYAAILSFLLFLLWWPLLLDSFLSVIVGPLAFSAGVWIFGSAVRDLGLERLTMMPKPGRATFLETGGMYAEVRHPAYAGLFLIGLGYALRTRSSARLTVVVALFAFLVQMIAVEETFLNKEFSEYWSYADEVQFKMIPGLF